MCREAISYIYKIHVLKGGVRSSLIEDEFRGELTKLKITDLGVNGERDLYDQMFADECKVIVEGLYFKALETMKVLKFEACGDQLDTLDFIQKVVATALWKFRYDVGDALEQFARDFDRLDVPEERNRLYDRAQSYKP